MKYSIITNELIFLNDFAIGLFLFRKITKYKVILLYKAIFATFCAYETLQKHIFMEVTPR